MVEYQLNIKLEKKLTKKANVMSPKNSIAIEGNGNITIQDVTNGNITINTNNPDEVLKQLKQLNEAQIDSLLQIVDNQKERLSELFKTLLNGIAKEKNVVMGNITDVKGNVDIGDKVIYNYYYTAETKLPKELTLNIPKTYPDDIVGREEDLQSLRDLLCNDKKVVVVNGLGGIGKTTLVQVYVSKYYDDYEHIAWVTQNSESIANDFINTEGLIKNLGVETANSEPGQIFNEIVRKLKSIQDKPNLLIIDNAEQSLKKYLDILPGQPQWHLLVTSREEITGFHLKPLGF